MVCLCFGAVARAYDYGPNDLVTEVVSYDAGSGAGYYDYPDSALGRPTIDTDYYGALRPVVSVYPSWLPGDIVTVGVGGHLTLKFSHKVADDKNNPYGFDFIVFGNAMQAIDGVNPWTYGDPCDVKIKTSQSDSEFGKVSVSQDGATWYTFENGPFADSFAPTLGREYDPANPNDSYEGWVNLWWGEVTNPTLPFDPNLEPNDFKGASVAQMCEAYGSSAGGTAFDLQNLAPEDYEALSIDPNTGRRWIQYVKIECTATDPEQGPLPEVDAISDVSCCGDYKHAFPVGDVSEDCTVDYEDLRLLSYYWLAEISDQNDPAKSADIYEDAIVNFRDFALIEANWLGCTWECE